MILGSVLNAAGNAVKEITRKKKTIKGTVILMKNNAFGFNNLVSGTADRVLEIVGQKVTLQLVSAEHADPVNGNGGKLGKQAALENWNLKITSPMAGDSRYKVYFEWDEEFGTPGAIIVRNNHSAEFYLKTITLEDVPGKGRIHFLCNSWVYPDRQYKKPRVFFANKTYLPHETPAPLRKYREEELKVLRGDGKGERKKGDRVYDYAVYNDLGNPDSSSELARPVLGGVFIPGTFTTYVPRDEQYGHLKMSDFIAFNLKALVRNNIPAFEIKFFSNEFNSFKEVDNLYFNGIPLPTEALNKLTSNIPLPMIKEMFRTDGERLLKFPVPQVIKDRSRPTAWRTDEEFAREMLAGVNPLLICLLREFPPASKLDPEQYGNQNSSITKEHIEHNLDGLSVEEALRKNKLFILDHHGTVIPYLRKINTTSTKTHASRTLLFLRHDETLKPVAIELSLPNPAGDKYGIISKVYTPAEHGVEGSIWQFAKTFVAVNDCGHHQIISHWLNTHAVLEPFIIATNRQLSVVHPIYKLLHPHFRDTMTINALAREILINAGGIIEETFYPAKYSMLMSSEIYKSWNFLDQALPNDLKKRGIAEDDANSLHGLRLLIEDYPYAVDGLKIWFAIEKWVRDYCSFYYKTDEMVQQDAEVQAWWKELREVGHGDKKDEPWWPKMQTREELIESCTIIIWIASALHAAVNFGQYAYGGYSPNRPTLSRRLVQIEEEMKNMNTVEKLKNRVGPVNVPYTLLYPNGEVGLSGKGIPNTNENGGKLGKLAALESWNLTFTPPIAGETQYKVSFEWDEQFGAPGAIIIRNNHAAEFYLKTITLEDVPGQGRTHFVCNSWIYPDRQYKKPRVFFANKTYLPHETPAPLRKYREEELKVLRGDGEGQLKSGDRVYDYAVYNDLGNPDLSSKLVRPILGGSAEYPYPRRGRTGRPPSRSDPNTESRVYIPGLFSTYVPRDEQFGHLKLTDFIAYNLKALVTNVIPAFEAFVNFTPNEFDSFKEVDNLYFNGIQLPTEALNKLTSNIPLPMIKEMFRMDGQQLLKFPVPQAIEDRNKPTAWRTDEEFAREMLAGALRSNKLFILDHHDTVIPYLRGINNTSAKTYASRTLLLLRGDNTLKPVAIELSLPHPTGDKFGVVSKVYTPVAHGVEGSIWQFAKAFVAINDCTHHQLNTHAVLEPFVIATNRQLSVVHPIYKLLHPHFRDTMTINALARELLVNAGGVIETTFCPGKYSMEMSSEIYKSWNFLEQALPNDLKKRGIAVDDANSLHGLRLLIEDYPYAVDGLKIWFAIEKWVRDYCSFYYKTDEMVQQDPEVQAWWKELREVGHGDKKDEPWWPKMQTREELIESCTIIIWIASALHAAVNFGQFAYAGFSPNRPTLSRRLMPEKGTPEYAELEKNPEKRLAEIEEEIIRMNKDKKLKNRVGPVNVPYTLLYPTGE
ncbi:PLAT/LH2 domain - like 7, partial [Theobroma cacao]